MEIKRDILLQRTRQTVGEGVQKSKQHAPKGQNHIAQGIALGKSITTHQCAL